MSKHRFNQFAVVFLIVSLIVGGLWLVTRDPGYEPFAFILSTFGGLLVTLATWGSDGKKE